MALTQRLRVLSPQAPAQTSSFQFNKKNSCTSDASESQVPPKADHLAFYVPSNNYFPSAKCFNGY